MDILDKIDNFLNEESSLIPSLKKSGNKTYYYHDPLYNAIEGAVKKMGFKITAQEAGIDIKKFADKSGKDKFVVTMVAPPKYYSRSFPSDAEKHSEALGKYLKGKDFYEKL